MDSQSSGTGGTRYQSLPRILKLSPLTYGVNDSDKQEQSAYVMAQFIKDVEGVIKDQDTRGVSSLDMIGRCDRLLGLTPTRKWWSD